MGNQDDGTMSEKAADPNTQVSTSPQSSADEKIQKILDKALYAGGSPEAQKLRNFLNGTWLGEPLHVVLTDLPIGAWTAAMLFDLLDLIVDRDEFALAADASIGVGLAGAAGAAWSCSLSERSHVSGRAGL